MLPRMLWAGELGSEELGVREHGELAGLQAGPFNFGSIPFLGWGRWRDRDGVKAEGVWKSGQLAPGLSWEELRVELLQAREINRLP